MRVACQAVDLSVVSDYLGPIKLTQSRSHYQTVRLSPPPSPSHKENRTRRSCFPPAHLPTQACCTSVHVVACWLYGGIRLPIAIGAVVVPLAGRHTPLSGQVSPVRAVVPRGLRIWISPVTRRTCRVVMIDLYEIVVKTFLYGFICMMEKWNQLSALACENFVWRKIFRSSSLRTKLVRPRHIFGIWSKAKPATRHWRC